MIPSPATTRLRPIQRDSRSGSAARRAATGWPALNRARSAEQPRPWHTEIAGRDRSP